jgi:WD40 repeat protein
LELSGHNHYISEVAWSPSGKQIATASLDSTAKVWDADSGELLQTFEGHIAFLEGVSWSPDGLKIVTAGADNVAYVWNAQTGTILLRLSGHKDGVTDVVWSPAGDLIATLSWDQSVRVWDSETGMQLFQFNTFALLGNNSISWSPSGDKLIISGIYYHRIWDICYCQEFT